MFSFISGFCKSLGCIVSNIGEDVVTISESLTQEAKELNRSLESDINLRGATSEARVAKAVALEEIKLINSYIDWVKTKENLTKDQLDFLEDNTDTTTIRPFKYDAMSIEELYVEKRSNEDKVRQLELEIIKIRDKVTTQNTE
ncbi:hypothetical protein EDB59_0871 [Vibrio crassostreae]|uniref:hypothetical protein n=1 Tax=Vibrio crassostreae TaxID=246167 RepID=UPI000F49D23C|nr:hypothetical protein [Vibrio crassostreae]ROR70222.1 hypothetical protein EDB59_0871 [Vibrio crassostreae]